MLKAECRLCENYDNATRSVWRASNVKQPVINCITIQPNANTMNPHYCDHCYSHIQTWRTDSCGTISSPYKFTLLIRHTAPPAMTRIFCSKYGHTHILSSCQTRLHHVPSECPRGSATKASHEQGGAVEVECKTSRLLAAILTLLKW